MVTGNARLQVRTALVALVAVAAFSVAAEGVTAAETTAEFDWRMPARTGVDANGDGVIDSFAVRSRVVPDSWTMHFNACASTAADGASIVSYTWYIDRQFVAAGAPCGGFTYYFPEEGVYEVTLEVRDSSGVEAHVIKDVPVQDWLVVALGDSFGSGQGNPDIPIPGPRFDEAERALAEYNNRLRELQDLERAYHETERKVDLARRRLSELNLAIAHEIDVCNPFSPNLNFDECLAAPQAVDDATDLLFAALYELGLEALLSTLGLIEDSLQEGLATAQAAVDLAVTAVGEALQASQDADAALSPVWQNKRCNRSSIAGLAQAAIALEEADPRTSVTLVHLACSGAEVVTGVLGPYAGVEPPPRAGDLRPQVDEAEFLIGGREVDAVLLSIGGNDVGFGPIVEACIAQEPCHEPPTNLEAAVELQVNVLCGFQDLFNDDCRQWWEGFERVRSADEIFSGGASILPSRYRRLADRLAEAFPAVAAEPGRVFITEYPNALGDVGGSVCDSGSHPDPFMMLPGISPEEAGWLLNTVTASLNAIVEEAATNHQWTFVGGIFNAFSGHGYCANDGWFRRLQDSFLMQGTKEGVVHPTAAGHVVYGERILEGLLAGLYPDSGGGGSESGFPRSPNFAYTRYDTAPPTVTGVPDRGPNGSGWYSGDVTIDWQAADPAPSSGTPTDPPDTLASTEGSGIVYTSEPSCDPADRCASGSLSLSIDKTLPSVACQSPAPTFLLGAVGATASAEVSDTLSGVQTATVSAAVDTATVGLKSVSLTGQDVAGNERTVNCPYSVEYVFSGFSSPVDGGGVLNVAKAGRGIPLKWRLTDGSGAPVANLTTATVTVQNLSCSVGASADLVEETIAGGSGLQNLGDGYYQLNWKTPSTYADSCKTMRLDLGEGLVHAALFKFVK